MILDLKTAHEPNTSLPSFDGAKIWFVDEEDTKHIGLWIEAEKMFFIGFRETGDFRFKFQIKHWGYLPEDFNEEDLILNNK